MLILATLVLALLGLTLFLAWRYSPPDLSQYDAPLTPPLMAASEVSDAHQLVLAKLADSTSKPALSTEGARQRMEDLKQVLAEDAKTTAAEPRSDDQQKV